MPQPPPPASQSTLLVHLSSDGHSDQHYPDRSTYQQLPDSPATPPPHLTDRRNACDKADDAIIAVEADSASDHEYDISAIGDYRRSKSWSSQTNPRLVQRGIEVVRRAHPTPPAVPRIPEPVAAPAGTLARYARSRSPPNAHPATRERSNPRRPSEDRPLARRQPPEEALRPGQEVGEEEDEAEEDIDSEEDEEEMEEDESWIQSFCNVVGHEYFAEVSEEFIEDDFNLTGLGPMVPMYKQALEMILDVDPDDDSDVSVSNSESVSDPPQGNYRRRDGHRRTPSDYSVIESSAELLYGLIHQRFITSRQGIQVMYEKYLSNHFGFCPRVSCNNARVLPCGYTDAPGADTVKLFCPSCCDIYVPPNSRFQSVDGCYFGTTFPSLFLMTFPELDVSGNGRKDVQASTSLNSSGGKKGGNMSSQPVINGVPAPNLAPGLGKGKRYEMRIYGFRVNERAKSGPRMRWLRDKPVDLTELDETARFGGPAAAYDSDEEDEPEESASAADDDDEESMGVPRAVPARSSRRGGGSPMDMNEAR